MGEFDDPRLVAVYDTLNGYRPGTQPDFYLRVARQYAARSVVEVGCRTGLITRLFAAEGYAPRTTVVTPEGRSSGGSRSTRSATRSTVSSWRPACASASPTGRS